MNDRNGCIAPKRVIGCLVRNKLSSIRSFLSHHEQIQQIVSVQIHKRNAARIHVRLESIRKESRTIDVCKSPANKLREKIVVARDRIQERKVLKPVEIK